MNNPIKYIKPFMTKHEPELLMAMGISGLVFSTVWGIKSTFKAAKIINNYKETYGKDKIDVKEAIKLTWKSYLPVVVSTAVSIPCIIASNRVSTKRYTALATAYTISETALQEYQEKTKEIAGEKQAQKISESVSKDQIDKTYSGTNQIIMTGNGESLFYEPLSGRYFKSSWNEIQKKANELNSEAMHNMSGVTTLNDWYDKLGLEQTDVGDTLGWDMTYNTTSMIDISISSHVTKDNIPCGAIYYNKRPTVLTV